jgi:ABC-type lipoprotein release transport system permease subunit
MGPHSGWRSSKFSVYVTSALAGVMLSLTLANIFGFQGLFPAVFAAIIGLVLGVIFAVRVNRYRDHLMKDGTKEDWEAYWVQHLFIILEFGFAVLGFLIGEMTGLVIGVILGIGPSLWLVRMVRKRYEDIDPY